MFRRGCYSSRGHCPGNPPCVRAQAKVFSVDRKQKYGPRTAPETDDEITGRKAAASKAVRARQKEAQCASAGVCLANTVRSCVAFGSCFSQCATAHLLRREDISAGNLAPLCAWGNPRPFLKVIIVTQQNDLCLVPVHWPHLHFNAPKTVSGDDILPHAPSFGSA